MVMYEQIGNKDARIMTCSGDGWDEEDEGLFLVPEVSAFDPSQCLMFKHNSQPVAAV